MAAPLGLGEPIHRSPPANPVAGASSALVQADTGQGIREARKYAIVITYGLVACGGMTAWVYFLGLALLRTVEWTVG